MKRLVKLLKGEEGLVAIEYALIALFVAIAIIAVVTDLGEALQGIFQQIVDALTGGGAEPPVVP